MSKQFVTILMALFLPALAGCAAAPVLLAKSAANAAGIDLSGEWSLRDEPGAPLSRAGDGEQTIRMPRRLSQRRPQRPEPVHSTAVAVFLETGKHLKITQTVDGLFVSFDRAVVEEFTFGEHRTVAVGPIEAQRVSGWDGPVFVVETLDDDGAILTDSWQLNERGDELTRNISITVRGKQKFAARQVFDRT